MFDVREEVVGMVIWDADDRKHVQFEVKGGGSWAGAKRKDFWDPDFPWEEHIRAGTRLRLYTVSYCIIVGFEAFIQGGWVPVWCAVNDFQTKAERDASTKAYTDFIEREAKAMALNIDAGMDPVEVLAKTGRDHTGNTLSWAVNLAVGRECKNKEAAERFRRAWNAENGGGQEDKGGVINAAVITIER